MLLFPYIKNFFIYLYVWSADCNSAESQYLAGVGIGILECEYGPGPGYQFPGAGVSLPHRTERFSYTGREQIDRLNISFRSSPKCHPI